MKWLKLILLSLALINLAYVDLTVAEPEPKKSTSSNNRSKNNNKSSNNNSSSNSNNKNRSSSNSRKTKNVKKEEVKPEDEDKDQRREGKLFSLFNIVQFQNSGCRSQSTLNGGGTGRTNRNGTCYTSQECASQGGTASGNCAAGFGVCCIFLVSISGTTIQQNCTYIRNPGFPSTYTGGTNGVSYTIRKCSNNVCSLRLDFESFTIKGTGNTVEEVSATNNGGICLDTFTITTATKQGIPTICGQNTGQHMYIDIGNSASDTVLLNFAFAGTSTTRQWEIKVTQIPCYGECSKAYQAPPGCLQYQTGLTGQFSTFNFIPTNDNHLAGQDYSICIRQEQGYCCIQYSPCTDVNSFSLDTQGLKASVGSAMTDSGCSGDYVEIPGSNGVCNQAANRLPIVSKYCGQYFNANAGLRVNSVVCDCTQPFQVNIHTDLLPDLLTAGTPNVAKSRGACFTWMQIPCGS